MRFILRPSDFRDIFTDPEKLVTLLVFFLAAVIVGMLWNRKKQ